MKREKFGARRSYALAASLSAALGLAIAQPDVRGPDYYSFGDSLSDTGNLSQLFPGDVVSELYYRGVYSNGPAWIDIISRNQALYPGLDDLQLTPSTNGINFAHAGAKTIGEHSRGIDVSTLDQIQAFEDLITEQTIAVSDEDIFIVWTGPNDYTGRDSALPEERVGVVVRAIEFGIHQLIDNGARTIAVLNMPDLSLTPAAKQQDAEVQEELRVLSDIHNDELARVVARIRSTNRARVVQIDIDGLYKDVTNDPSRFGFGNVDEGCLSLLKILEDCPTDQMFYDPVHPAYGLHSLIAVTVLDELENLRF